MEEKKKPVVSILRSSDDDYLSPLINPDSDELAEDIFLTSNVASANDCTGIAVTVPEDEAEAQSIADLANIPVTPRHEDGEYPPRAKL